MTYNALLKRLQKMTPKQLRQKVKLLEGCSGKWNSLTSVEVADEDEWEKDREPVSAMYKMLPEVNCEPKLIIKKGETFLLHDH